MSPRYSPLLPSAILFAHRGARAHAPENTLESFRLALRLGATGLESDAWVTADGVVVLDHDGVVGGLLRRRRISDVERDQLPAHIPSLAELYEACGAGFEFSLDVKDPAAVEEILRVAHAAGGASRLWLCHPEVALLATWRELDGDVRLVNSTRLAALEHGPERRAAELRAAGVDAMNLHHNEWTPGLVALVHRFRVLGFGWDAQHVRTITALLHAGVDGIFSDHVDRMLEAVAGDRVPDVVPEELRAELNEALPEALPGELPDGLPDRPDDPT